ncbi:MAG: DUF1016 N-terminal domain-containing protein [Micropruina sp.]|uniref:DUF1016 N-terminal domain-containing protein n=1 Tax=Micropruina sp. TaxID=2737536 RepID=UPI0039E277DF
MTLMNWHIGRMIDIEILKERRAGYDQEIVATLSPHLTGRFGRGFDKSSLYRMIKFSQAFPDIETVATLSPRLSWSHFREIIALPLAEARTFLRERGRRAQPERSRVTSRDRAQVVRAP